MNLSKLRDQITSHFNNSELHNLCFDLEINYENLPGDTLMDKARELVEYCKRHEKLSALVTRCQILRPDVLWLDEGSNDALVYNYLKMPQPNLYASQLLGMFNIKDYQINAKVHQQEQFELSLDAVQTAFKALNVKRNNNKLSQYYPGPRFRPVVPPKFSETSLEFNFTLIDYAYIALIKDKLTDTAIKQKVQEIVNNKGRNIATAFATDHPHFNAYAVNIIGTEICLLTSDGFILLRWRGEHVNTARKKWDVSVSGHPVMEDISERDGLLEFGRTVKRETWYEINEGIRGDPRRIEYTGLHRNKESGDIDLCVFWPIDENAERLRQMITKQHPDQNTRIFKTTEKPREYKWVKDTHNLIVEFDGPTIMQALAEEKVLLEDFIPEALVSLELALLNQGRNPIGIGI